MGYSTLSNGNTTRDIWFQGKASRHIDYLQLQSVDLTLSSFLHVYRKLYKTKQQEFQLSGIKIRNYYWNLNMCNATSQLALCLARPKFEMLFSRQTMAKLQSTKVGSLQHWKLALGYRTEFFTDRHIKRWYRLFKSSGNYIKKLLKCPLFSSTHFSFYKDAFAFYVFT